MRSDQSSWKRLCRMPKVLSSGIVIAAAYDGIFFQTGTVFASGLGHGQQFAEVEKVALRALLFVEVKGRAAWAPFGDEGLGGHGLADLNQ